MANLLSLQTLANCSPFSLRLSCSSSSSSSCSSHLAFPGYYHDFPTSHMFAGGKELMSVKAQYRENVSAGVQFRRSGHPVSHALRPAGRSSASGKDSSFPGNGGDWINEDGSASSSPLMWNNSSAERQQEGIISSSSAGLPLQLLTQEDVAEGLVLREPAGTSWTTGSGLEGPTGEIEDDGKEELRFPDLSKSPRRKMRVAFTCNVCGERTIRAINPFAYTDGTVFVQCKGCDVFHKLVDNLNLFHEMRGKIYRGYDIPWYANDQPYGFFDGQYPQL